MRLECCTSLEVGCAVTGSVFQEVVEKTGIVPQLVVMERRILRDQLQELEFETFFGAIGF